MSPLARAEGFCARFGLRVPVLMAPMAGACPVPLAAAVSRAGGMGACGALLMQPEAIGAWAGQMRAASNGPFQVNLWVPDPAPVRDAAAEARVRAFLAGFGPEPPAGAGDAAPPDFAAQCEALLAAGPAVASSIMGVFPETFVARLKAHGVAWFACVTSVVEARMAAAAGADALVVQGVEAGGHRGSFEPGAAARQADTLLSLLPRVADVVDLPLVATGGIADGRGVAAALALGASAVQIGTALLRSPEAGTAPAWAEALGREGDTVQTRAFSGRLGRSLATRYALAAADGPTPAPYPVQRGLTASMREAAAKRGDIGGMQAWAGQSHALARTEGAEAIVQECWALCRRLLGD